MKPLLHAVIVAFVILLSVAPADAQSTPVKSPVPALILTPAPPGEDDPKTLREALQNWSWTWTGPQSNTVVNFEHGGSLVTREKVGSQWEIINANTVRISSGSRPVILLAFNKNFSRFVQAGVVTAPIAGVRDKHVPVYPPSPIARFTFNSTEPAPGASVRNARQHDGVLDLAGIYEHHDKESTGERAIFSVPELDYQAFTVVVHLRPDDIGEGHRTLLMGGTSYRWLELYVSREGGLSLGLDSRAGYPIPGVSIKTGQWTTLAVSCDVKVHRLAVYMNGRHVAKIAIPLDFKFDVIGTSYERGDKAWTFTDYSSANTFKGLVNELVVYNRVLLDVQVESLQFTARLPNKTP
ncbi:MAG: hypothetical protein NTY98_02265 [Verrucomicrobia bacterium]|nr:hypothetical protein [Verrucomicrobiota bacterium]